MQITYAPEGAKPRVWEFAPRKLHNVEAEAIEKVTGWTFAEYGEKFLKGSVLAQRATLWVLMKREEPTLKFGEIQFTLGDLEIDFSDVERIGFREALEAKAATEGLDDAEQAALDDLLAKEAELAGDPKG